MTKPPAQLIVALDVSSSAEAAKIVTTIGDDVQLYKVGMQLYTAEGPRVVRELISSGKQVFLDLKFHDIPNTVGAAVREAVQLGVTMLTVHAAGGTKMLKAAVESAAQGKSSARVLAVTVLTSMDAGDICEIGVEGPILDQVVRLGALALHAGCAGVVSSAQEVKALRERLGDNFLAVTPGVRPSGAARGDQARVVTPAEAMAAGATHIVVGRPITEASDPAEEAVKILDEMGSSASQLSA
jgi:orotidine-5'-phosphate decarboxylase